MWFEKKTAAALSSAKSSNIQFAASTNITVDDTNSTIWTFVGGWSAVTPETPCPGCFAQPDPKQVFNSSWHDGSVVSGSVTFQGSAIYIYGIDMTATSGTNISFSMNNPTTAGFHYFGSTGTTYNVLFFSATNLDSSVEHTVSFIGQTSLTGAGAMLFDYANITVDQQLEETVTLLSSSSSTTTSTTSPSPSSTPLAAPQPPPTRKSNTGAIIGAVVGGVGGLAILVALFLILRRRRRTSSIHFDGGNFYEAPRRRISANGFLGEPHHPEARGPSFIGARASSSGVDESTKSAPPASTVPSPEQVPTASLRPAVTTATPTSRSEKVVLAWN
ncbi:hypothetical protein GGX14DRAFT_698156 [Mycena pura]|uniref:Mid2 domain-containing protein n=1 Tax=Mycena pura TaxID=153505 RepID=A0AAD6YBG3_9AGAR|nr:hypothetical protein GGX14DRAFT_698156 [Mycena pura]